MTPETIGGDVKKLVSTVGTNTSPIYLAIEPESYSQVNECFPAVAEKIKRDGGAQRLGWQIWKSDVIVEAEFHAVWESPDGELKDITPKQLDIHKILFLPDPKAKYIGAQVDNIRINIYGNRLVDDFIEIAKAIFRIENKGERAYQHELRLSRKEAGSRNELKGLKDNIYLMIQQGMSRNSFCFCGSRNRYKHCHGKKLVKYLNRL